MKTPLDGIRDELLVGSKRISSRTARLCLTRCAEESCVSFPLLRARPLLVRPRIDAVVYVPMLRNRNQGVSRPVGHETRRVERKGNAHHERQNDDHLGLDLRSGGIGLAWPARPWRM